MINLIKYIPVLLITIIFSDNRGWTHPETGWQVVSGQNMCIFTNYNSYVDNDIAEFNQNDAIGVFYNNQCIGWAYIQESITIIPTIGNDGQNSQYPSNGDIVDFFIYDDSKNQILEAYSLNDLPNWQVNTMPNISQLISCSYNLPINSLGECIESCNYDVNQNNNVDILDILEIINQNILCNDCNESDCGDINNDNLINVQDITIILDIILNY